MDNKALNPRNPQRLSLAAARRAAWSQSFGERIIVHVDMDAFFAQVEVLDNPQYRGLPLIVGGDPRKQRGVVATCSYEARAFGVRSAMPIRQAVKLCPQAIFVRPRMARYREISRRIREVLSAFTPAVEAISIDEAFLDMTGCEYPYASAWHMGRELKNRIREETGLIASVGIGPNKFVAKLASDRGKPDGLVVVEVSRLDDFLSPLPVQSLWGVGAKTARKLAEAGIFTVADVRRCAVSRLCRLLGDSLGQHMHRLAFGIDPRPVQPETEAKSLGRETTFSRDIPDGPELRTWLARLTAEVGRRLRRAGLAARTVTVKIRYPDFETHTRSHSLPRPFRDDDRLFREASRLLDSLQLDRPLRLLGVYVSQLEPCRQMSLFPDPSDRLADVIDSINQRYGPGAICRGREIDGVAYPRSKAGEPPESLPTGSSADLHNTRS